MKDKELYHLRDERKKSQEETLLITKKSLTQLVEENLKFRSIDFPFSIKDSKESEVIYKALQMIACLTFLIIKWGSVLGLKKKQKKNKLKIYEMLNKEGVLHE